MAWLRTSCRQATALHLLVLALTILVLVTMSRDARLGGVVADKVRLPLPDAGGLNHLDARPDDLESLRLEPIGRDVARRVNAQTPFATLNPPPARPFKFTGSPLARARSVDCLALAAMAEAGSGAEDQKAVIQVIINRVRHPAFVNSICGVVFQGAERRTGCQFSFTCDGSLARRYSNRAWAASKERANAALNGAVFAPVGAATHYHTDWVHPVWSSRLEKIAAIRTHLFFRWKGYWGTPQAAASRPYSTEEPAISGISYLPAHADAFQDRPLEQGTISLSGNPPQVVPKGDHSGAVVAALFHNQYKSFIVQLIPPYSTSASLMLARNLCGSEGYCKVWAWADVTDTPRSLPVPSGYRKSISFSYTIDMEKNEYSLFDCTRYADTTRDKCLPRQGRD